MATWTGILLSLAVLLLAGCGTTPVQAGSVWQNASPGMGVAHPARMDAPAPVTGLRRAPLPPRRRPFPPAR